MDERRVLLGGSSKSLSDVLKRAASEGAEWIHISRDNEAKILADVPALQHDFESRRSQWHEAIIYDLRGPEPVERGGNEVQYEVLKA